MHVVSISSRPVFSFICKDNKFFLNETQFHKKNCFLI